ncbi:putative peptidase S54, rhomboid, Rhomboid-like superfamily [Helianthus annuus]|uniref:RHOMBOID-like protein n=1 Tax=Helianthus annuus TaxID=4232 RepID=A0A251UL46_HELAN|nr:RHOMBOID-like protein 1 [Helianthus annuus]KAF5802426.1 putative peptidase S54, rhomboid, Rhomboid-like superfamily [Helianthus annuus]KAJ0560555.1 putative peptidase S54, rhomboid, Rhomboid-like superfamily [Helianthus annuus]KAJ0566924.1 putative peptidase S54, rhomboid, Rhomboid-like superfamily [Helianthus annuus]KAJ0573584.1 putative peptidase S54, rhomboid, Rhomboid-like superfamily [Helianthus annuus]KAJ0737947.1 putative peptidase S54, rhomboid, Rhomboid-like superfamily [Helianthus
MEESRRSEIRLKVNSRRFGGGNIIHPVEVEQSSPTPFPAAVNQSQTPSPFREVKHFKKWLPWLIPTFVIADTVLFIITMYVNDCPKNSVSCIATFLKRLSFQPFKENPLLGPSSETLHKMGALDVSKVVDDHQGWRLITCIWLHGGLFHLLANMLSLLVIGIRLEREFGFIRIGLLYVISGFGGSLLSALFLQSNISVGASGAVFGLLGAMLSELITNWTIYTNKMSALLTLVIIIVINLAVGILPHVDNFAHLGGFFSGFLLGFVFLMRPQFGWVNQRYTPAYSRTGAKPKYKTYQRVLWLLSLILVVAGLIAGLVSLLRGVNLNDHCSWCHYMSCVPTSRWSCDTDPVSCMSVQTGNQYTLTCSDGGKNGTYLLDNPNQSMIRSLCSQLCR